MLAAECSSAGCRTRTRSRGARLGRAVCRTYLTKREAIADATVLIDARASNRSTPITGVPGIAASDAFESARADIDQARALRYNARVLTLAGMIEHDQRDFDLARRDLTQAWSSPQRMRRAVVSWRVEVSVERWPPGALSFAGAAQCYDALGQGDRDVSCGNGCPQDVNEVFRARQLAGFDSAIADDHRAKKRRRAERGDQLRARRRSLQRDGLYEARGRRSAATFAVEDLGRCSGAPVSRTLTAKLGKNAKFAKKDLISSLRRPSRRFLAAFAV